MFFLFMTVASNDAVYKDRCRDYFHDFIKKTEELLSNAQQLAMKINQLLAE